MLLVSLISYIDRNTLALLAPTILKETRISARQYGLIISAFSIAYMLGNPVWGRILDRFGLRRGMTLSVFAWTLASISHAFAAGFGGFAAARAALGFGEGATFPGGLRTVVQTLPASARGRGIAVAYSGGSLGAVITPLIVTPIYLHWGWRAAFFFTGGIGLGWLALWSFIGRRPEMRHAPTEPLSRTRPPRLSDPRLWAFICAYALGALPLAFVIYGMSIYMSQGMDKSQAFIGEVLWIPPLGWETGYFVWGWLSDRTAASSKGPVAGIGKLMFAAALLSLPFAVATRIPGVWLFLLELFVAMFAAAGFLILSVAYATHVYSAEHAGFIAGVGAGSWSAGVALAMPLFGYLLDRHWYDTAFLLSAVVPSAGYLGWLRMSRKGVQREFPVMSRT